MSKRAIIYYSYTGNTKKIVDEIIKNNVYADVFEIKPKEPFNEEREIFEREQELKRGQEEIIEIIHNKINFKEYDSIIIGTPVWWYTMSSPIRSFLNENDLEGKVLIPFATNEGGIGTTFEDIKKYAKGAIVKNEMNIKFCGNNMETSLVGITDWIDSL